MSISAERMRVLRERRRKLGLRELRLVVPDSCSRPVRRRIAAQVARLVRAQEEDAMSWVERVSELDSPEHSSSTATR